MRRARREALRRTSGLRSDRPLGVTRFAPGSPRRPPRRGKALDAIMRLTIHRSEKVAHTYIRQAKLFDDNAAVGLA